MENSGDVCWTPVEMEHVVKDKWMDFRKVKYRLPDGTEFSPFYNFSKKDYAVIVATDEDGRYLCVKQYRHGIRKCTVEFAAGGIEVDSEHDFYKESEPLVSLEVALSAAKRELKEETGYESLEWEHVITYPSTATTCDNFAYIFRAKNCKKVSEQELDDTEFVNVLTLDEDEILEKIKSNEFAQAIHAMAFYMCKDK